jgi:hypothetical protein
LKKWRISTSFIVTSEGSPIAADLN